MNSKKKYIAYYRVSTKKQGDSGLGLESQRAYIEHFVPSNDIVESFTDVMSGSVKDRPELMQAIELCIKKGYYLIVAKVDRLSRKTEDALHYFNMLDTRLVACDVPNINKFTLTVYMAIADRERELVSIRTKAALKAKKARGEKLGTPRNFSDDGRRKGWEANRRRGSENKNNIKVMETISMYRNRGLTLQAVADKLKHDTPSGARYTRYHKTTVSRLHKRYLSITQ